jgi:hypothetical protein
VHLTVHGGGHRRALNVAGVARATAATTTLGDAPIVGVRGRLSRRP